MARYEELDGIARAAEHYREEPVGHHAGPAVARDDSDYEVAGKAMFAAIERLGQCAGMLDERLQMILNPVEPSPGAMLTTEARPQLAPMIETIHGWRHRIDEVTSTLENIYSRLSI